MKFTLYDIILNVNEVDEAIDSEAQIDRKFILISTPQNPHRNLNKEKYLFDFWRDDTYKKHSTAKVNTKIRVFSEGKLDTYNDYYAKIETLDYIRLAWRFKKLWIQKNDNLMWLTNLLVAITSIALSTYVSVRLAQQDKKINQIEIVNPSKLDDQQLDDLIKAMSKDNHILTLDTNQLNYIIHKLEKREIKKEKQQPPTAKISLRPEDEQ